MAKMLTDAACRNSRGKSNRREIRDGGATGLYLVIQPSGHKSWALRYRRPNGKPAEAAVIREALDFTRGRKVEAAERLGIGRNTITRKIQELGLDDK